MRRRGGGASTSAAAGGEERTEEGVGAGASASAAEGEAAHAANGSTTFFIYVIGGTSPHTSTKPEAWTDMAHTGYYPPSHPLVTGAPNAALDSFEALWELADFLGPAKPPTATRGYCAGRVVGYQAEREEEDEWKG